MRRLLFIPNVAFALTVVGGSGLAVALLPRGASAQEPAVVSAPRTLELGVDAGAVFGLGDESSIGINLPASRARVGFFLTNDTRWSLEPAVLLSYTKVEDADGVFLYNFEAGALYHFRAPTDLRQFEPTRGVSVAYVRPFVNWTGVTGDDGDSEFSAGAGLGIKLPWRTQLAWRLEATAGYGFDNEALRIGLLAGLSFFTRPAAR